MNYNIEVIVLIHFIILIEIQINDSFLYEPAVIYLWESDDD